MSIMWIVIYTVAALGSMLGLSLIKFSRLNDYIDYSDHPDYTGYPDWGSCHKCKYRDTEEACPECRHMGVFGWHNTADHWVPGEEK